MSGTSGNSAQGVSAEFVDLSGIATEKFENPYDALLAACEDDPVSICM